MNKFVKKITIFSIITILFIIIINGLGDNKIQFINVFLFAIISLFCVYGILSEFTNHSFSLIIMHWIFIIIFFVIAPVIQISFGSFPWNTNLSSSDIIFIQLEIITWSVFFNVGVFLNNSKNRNFRDKGKKHQQLNINNLVLIYMTILSFFAAIIIIKNTGFSSLFSRSTSLLTYDGSYSKMKTLLVKNFTKVTILFSTVISYISFKKNKKGIIFLLINFILLLITCFPTGLSRNAAGTIYMGLFVIFYFDNFERLKGSLKYIVLFLVAFIVFFPAINVFRNKTINEINFENTVIETIDNISENYLSGDYDAFAMIGNINKYTKNKDITYGKQMLGNLLFFVPRNLWNDKPIGSGSLVFNYFGYKFTNVSCPLIAEWYINFGFVGIIIGAIIFGILCSKIDIKYWHFMNEKKSEINLITLLYPFLLPSFFFMMRGDFLSTFSYTFAYISLFWVYSQFLKIKVVIK